MQYLLDTNICVFILRQKFGVGERVLQAGVSNCFISELTYAELLYGAEFSDHPENNKALVDRFLSRIRVVPIKDKGCTHQGCHSSFRQRESPLEKSRYYG